MKNRTKINTTALFILITLIMAMFTCMPVNGSGWITTEVVSDESTVDSSGPALAVGSDGTVHVAWYDSSGYDYDVCYRTRTSEGWNPTEVVAESTGSFPFPRSPSLAVDSEGTVHIAWVDFSGTDSDIFYRTRTSEGWNPTTEHVSENTGSSYNPSLAVDSEGTVHVAWQDDTRFADFDSDDSLDIFYRSKTSIGWDTEGAISWESSGISYSPSLAVDSEGTVHVAWVESGYDQIISYKKRTSTGWAPPEVVSTEGATFTESPSLAVDSEGIVHVAWQDYVPGYSYDVLYKNRTSAGWTTTTERVSENTGASYRPSLAVDSEGTVYVAWADYTDYSGSGTDEDIFYKKRTSAGWTTTEVVSDESTVDSSGPALAVGSDGTVHVAWADYTDYSGSGTDEDIFYKGFDVNPPVTEHDYINNWYNSDLTINLTATDDLAGVLYTFYTINDGATKRVDVDGQPTITTEDSDNQLEYWSTDNVQNEEAHKRLIEIKIDKTPPTTTDNYDNEWHNSDLTITLTPSSDLSGVSTTNYKINDGATKTVLADGPPIISTENADNTLEYWSVDVAGNEENHISLTGIKLDKTPPEGSIQINSGAATTDTPSVTLNLAATDATSGVAFMFLSNDNQVYTKLPYATSPAWDLTEGEGTKAVYVKYQDNSGLNSTAYPATITFSTNVPPVASFTFSPSTQEVNKAVTFTAAGSSDSDGTIATYTWDFGDGKTGSGATASHTYSSAGTYQVKLTVTDDDGATDTTIKTITITSQPPSPDIKISNGASSTDSATVTLNLAADPSSGIVEMRFSNDNSEWSDWQPYATTATWTLTDGDGTKTVYVQFKDDNGQIATYSDTITLATRSPPAFPMEYIIIAAVIAIILVVAFIIYKLLKRPKKPVQPVQLRITAEPATIVADGQTKSTITLQLLDKNGKPIAAMADTQVQITAANGKLEKPTVVVPKGKDAEKTAIISSREPGEVPVKAKAKGLKSVTITLNFTEEKRYCMHDGFPMPPQAKVCPKCGKAPPAGVDTKICHNCGNVIPVVAKFCSKCGTGQKER